MATTPTRTRMAAAERREQILDITRDIVGAEGFHAVTIDGVARAAGITRPVVYSHFDDLPDLLAALVAREGARALGQLAEIIPTDPAAGDPTELLMAALEGFLGAVQKDPATWRLVLMPPEGAPPALHETIAAGRAAVGMQLAGFAAPGLGERVGYEAPPDPELTATLLQAVSEEYARLLLQEPERYSIDRFIAHARWALGRFTGA